MLITIDNKELDGVRYAAAQMELKYFTIPEGKALTQVTIKRPSGKDIDNFEAYYFCRFMLGFIEKEKARQEFDSLATPKNNVVVLIDPMKDYDN